MKTVLSLRLLNRALLARQMLITREALPVVDVVEKIGGLQAQQSKPPFTGLWTRIADFQAESLRHAFLDRAVVRATMMRGTIHVVTSRDYLSFRASLQTMLTAAAGSILSGRVTADQMEQAAATALRHFLKGPHSFAAMRELLMQEFPDGDERAMGFAGRNLIPLVMVPDESEFSFIGSTFIAAEAWLGKTIDSRDRTQDIILRYLAAFGPASIRDAKAWSGLSKLEPFFEKLRPQLLTFFDEQGRELFDLPGAPRLPEDLAVPVRFLPAFDNLTLAHADRRRVIADEFRKRISTKNLQILPTFLIDGQVAGSWSVEATRQLAVLKISPFIKLSRQDKNALQQEGLKLVRFLFPRAARLDIVVETES